MPPMSAMIWTAPRICYAAAPPTLGHQSTMTKLNDFLTQHKIDPRRVVLASTKLETRTPDDKKLAATKKAMKAGKVEKNEETLKQKPRSGRPVTSAAITKAMHGRDVSGPVKTRIARAVNALLTQKKKSEVTFRDLF